MKVSVIMSSFLSMPGRNNLESKFVRAVNSFLSQTYQDKELIIISDGCQKTIDIFNSRFSSNQNIKLITIPKQPPYAGIRNIAYQIADGDIISYLDADDVIGKNHLQIIVDNFDLENDWVYYNDHMLLDESFKKFQIRIVEPRWTSIGTSSISHKNPKLIKGGDLLKWGQGYGHDFLFVLKLASLGTKFKKLSKNSEYIVCHYRGCDF